MKWETSKLEDLCALSKGKKHNEVVFSKDVYRYIQIEDLHGTGLDKFTKEAGTEAQPTDVLIAWDGANAGKVGVGHKGMIGSTLARIRPKSDRIEPRYLFWFLESNFEQIKSQRTGATIPHVNGTSLRQMQVPLPPSFIQKQIADTLDKADALRQKDQQLLQKYDALAQSIFYEIFGDPVQNNKQWPTQTIAQMVDFLTSGSRGWAQYYTESGDVFLRINNVKHNKLLLDDLVYVKAPPTAEAKRTKLQAGDILLSITADLGRTAVIPDGFPTAYINQHLALIRLKPVFNPVYVSQYLSSPGGQRQIANADKGGVKAGLNFEDIKSLKIAIPPLALQNQYSQTLSIIDDLSAKQKQSLKKSNIMFEGILTNYFS